MFVREPARYVCGAERAQRKTLAVRTVSAIKAKLDSANSANRSGMWFTSDWWRLCATRRPTYTHARITATESVGLHAD